MLTVEQLVARQVEFYEARRRAQAEQQIPGRGQVGKISFGPYLLVSHEMGSGGHDVARLTGERLGWQVFDREIVDSIAERAQVRHQLIESLDERQRSWTEELIIPALDRHDIGQVGYLLHLRQVLLTLGQHGQVVIIGRGARFLLPVRFGLSIRLIASFETRVQRIASAQNLELSEARARVQTSDRERADFIRHNFRHDAHDPLSHDLVFNTDCFEKPAPPVAEIVLTALQQKLGVAPRQ